MCNERLKYLDGLNDYYYYVKSESIQSDINFIREKDIKNVIINSRDEYGFLDVDWLCEVGENLEKIILTTPVSGRFSFAGLTHCRNLVKLKLNNYSKGFLDLKNNSKLKELDAHNYSEIDGLQWLDKLEGLILASAPKKILKQSVFENLASLKFLCISNTNLAGGLDFLKDTSIDGLALLYCKTVSLNGIENLKLTYLSVERCKNVQNSNSIYRCRNIKTLKLIDSLKLESVEVLDEMNDLEELIMLGSSYFENGDLSKIKYRFHVCNFDDKKHYNIKHADFISEFLKVKKL